MISKVQTQVNDIDTEELNFVYIYKDIPISPLSLIMFNMMIYIYV